MVGDRRALERAQRRLPAHADGARAEARRDRARQGRGCGLHLQDEMIAVRAALLAALLGVSMPAFAQSSEPSGIPPALSSAVAAYRAGDLATAEAAFRSLAPVNADAAAWLGAVLIDRGRPREGLEMLQRALAAGSAEAAQQLGVIYAQGMAGMSRDETHAARLFEQAA